MDGCDYDPLSANHPIVSTGLGLLARCERAFLGRAGGTKSIKGEGYGSVRSQMVMFMTSQCTVSANLSRRVDFDNGSLLER